jgi:hypothetical protein
VPTLPSFDASKDNNDDKNKNESDNQLDIVKQENDVWI